MIYLKNPLCLGMEESEYKEMLALGGMRQKHFEKNEVILSAGCTTHEIGLVLSGSVNIENLDLWGSKSILSMSVPDRFSGKLMHFPAKH